MKPFFSLFLKDQISESENEEIKAGKTMPGTDNLTACFGGDDVTIPGCDEISKPGFDLVTLKYPSDNDENMTDKFPSDNDETVEI